MGSILKRAKTAASVLLLSGLASCGWRDLPDRCPSGDGLVVAGYDGTTLPVRTAALTFDGGPNGATGAIAEVLNVADVSATFFVDGYAIKGSEDILDRLVDQGHLVGQRGWSGGSLEKVADAVTEVRRTDAALAPWISGQMYLLRSVDGDLGAGVATRLRDAGLGRYVGPIGWDLGPGVGLVPADAACEAAGTLAATCAGALASEVKAKTRAIVSLRGDASYAADVTRALVTDLLQSDYKLSRVDGIGDVARALVLAGGRPDARGGGDGCEEY